MTEFKPSEVNNKPLTTAEAVGQAAAEALGKAATMAGLKLALEAALMPPHHLEPNKSITSKSDPSKMTLKELLDGANNHPASGKLEIPNWWGPVQPDHPSVKPGTVESPPHPVPEQSPRSTGDNSQNAKPQPSHWFPF